MNKVFLIGRLTREPELRFTPGTGIAVANFTLAVDRNYVGQDGQKQADFIPVICWRKLAEVVANNLGKGRLVAVSGSIQTSSYQAQDGSKRYKVEVVADEVKFLDWPKDNKDDGGVDGFYPVDGDEDIPFR
ncbi:single-stranded DNA-binding protein [Fonticella tunisiensis]|uniref:Single-stranded DNA-binding protein n=1 Tax=Fonticella tunisiensis TaxID=1096341 RepID=A0A4R7KWP3_9CLOT|nr:single-stranded DNA-binding protein [Fonticella tunisiensis]TDT63400.1 single-strand binding protein [Fonticella tunisiensis]